MSNGAQQYLKLENRLLLLAWLNSLLGYESNRAMLESTKEVAEGFGADGYSFLYHHLVARGQQVRLPEDSLARYDDNIRTHLGAINRGRPDPITLRYFQHLAALYSEIFLDRLFNARRQMLVDLNAFVEARNSTRLPGEPHDEPFGEADLTKLAFWMATGSGKTLILHLNYRQFIHYHGKGESVTRPSLDNILLITPNEGLTEQHLRELEASGIPARRFDLNHSGLFSGGRDEVQVLEITKLVEQKRGGGVTVPVEAFEGHNLIFVDEGHKGAGGEVWRGYREALGETGFTFEYSATFGQALSAARNDMLTAEYGKAIVFDYSYRYFYGDGFGKDFRILNLKDEDRPEQTETLLLGNLLSFYEQTHLYDEHDDELRTYHLEKPLWVFVGSTVNAVYTRHGQKRSDVLTVVRFLHRLLQDRTWVVNTIEKLLKARSGLVNPDGEDVFLGRFKHLQDSGLTVPQIYGDILERVFHASAGGGLHLVDIRGGDGEIGLRAAGSEAYFGVINIGDTSAFKKLVGEEAAEIIVDDDAISSSLFEGINRSDSRIQILIGAKKFMEGWNSWRVSNMGLLNIGRGEGSQIIQLFGRGVRLRGKLYSLKRSSALDGPHPEHVSLLETLNIFAVRANYMAQFRDYLEREGVETESVIELPLFAWINKPALDKNLVVPRLPEGRDFPAEKQLVLAPDSTIRVRVDMSVKVQAMESTAIGLHTARVQAGQEWQIPAENLNLVDWEQVYLNLVDYKGRKGWTNLVVRPDVSRKIIEHVPYTIVADEAVVQPQTFAGRILLQEAVTSVLRNYMDALYRKRREEWESAAMEYHLLDESDPNLSFGHEGVSEQRASYLVRVHRSDQELVEAIQDLLKEEERLYQKESHELPRIHFDRHLYLPLLVEQSDKLKTIPPALKPSESRFVRDLKSYWDSEKDRSLAGKEVFLLRNLSRGKGVGFFEEQGFYPDFILWVIDEARQRILFLEPHGMVHAKAYIHDEKVRLHERLPELAREIGRRSGRRDIILDSYIVSATPYDVLRNRYDDGAWDRKRFAEKHILFQERELNYDYLKLLFTGS